MIQFQVRIVASGAGKMLVIGAVATAQGNTIGLKAHVVDAPQVGHHPYRVRTAMASSAELLRESIGIEHFRVKDIASTLLACAHGPDMFAPGPWHASQPTPGTRRSSSSLLSTRAAV